MTTDAALPVGVVTFLLTDIESSTPLWDDHPDHMPDVLALHEQIIDKVVAAHGGHWLKSRGEGDSTLSVFARATDAFVAAVELQRELQRQAWPGELTMRTRIALHSGEAQMRDGDYIGGVLNRAARIRGMAKGGEIVVSRSTHDLVADVLPSDISLMELGEHQMRGLRRPEFLYLVTGGGLEAPARRSDIDADLQRARRDRMVGRDRLVDDVERALARPGLVTLVGPGGIGKTRLCVEVCDRLRTRFSRVTFIDLSGVRDGVAVETIVQDSLVPEGGGPMSNEPRAEDFLKAMHSGVGHDRVLVSIDNCEHIVDDVGAVVSRLLAACPNVSVVATSREPLAVPGETVVRILPLECPERGAESDLNGLRSVESVRLLLDRTRDAGSLLDLTNTNASAISQLCRQLDGIPLAIELAAARLTSISPSDLLARTSRSLGLLRSPGGDARHRTLDDAIDWSYQLLDPSEQALLRRLAVFLGGFTLEAAEAICAGDDPDDLLPTADDVFLNLVELVSKSLVVFDRERDRYRLLEPIRFFARTKFDASDDVTMTSRRHATWALRSSQGWLQAQMSSGPLAESAAELDNVHAALAWLRATGDNATYMRIVAVSGITWLQSEWRRGREACALAMEMAAAGPTSARLRAAVTLSRGMVEQRVSARQSIPFLEDAAEQHAAIDDPIGRAWSLFFLGRAVVLHDRARGAACLEEAIDVFTRVGQPVGAVWSLINLVTDANDRGDLETSRRILLRALDAVDHAHLESGRGIVVCELAFNAILRGEIEEGRRLFREGLAQQRLNSDRWNLIGSLSHAAWGEFVAGALDEAAALLIESIEITLELEDAWQRNESLLAYAAVQMRAGNLEGARKILAATGADVEAPFPLETHRHSIVALSLEVLEPLLAPEFADAALEGRRVGAIAVAEALVAAHRQR